jgi:hypothetical protein
MTVRAANHIRQFPAWLLAWWKWAWEFAGIAALFWLGVFVGAVAFYLLTRQMPNAPVFEPMRDGITSLEAQFSAMFAAFVPFVLVSGVVAYGIWRVFHWAYKMRIEKADDMFERTRQDALVSDKKRKEAEDNLAIMKEGIKKLDAAMAKISPAETEKYVEAERRLERNIVHWGRANKEIVNNSVAGTSGFATPHFPSLATHFPRSLYEMRRDPRDLAQETLLDAGEGDWDGETTEQREQYLRGRKEPGGEAG